MTPQREDVVTLARALSANAGERLWIALTRCGNR